MKSRQTVIGAIVLSLVLALVLFLGPGLAQEPDEEERPAQSYTIEATLDSEFSYQGVLKENDMPVNGRRDMVFRLYSDNGCTNLLGSPIARPDELIVDGVFSVVLNVNQAHFNGRGLWLQVAVEGTAVACQEILPVPYALGLRPGANVTGHGTVLSVSSADGDALQVETASTTTSDAAIRGVASATSGQTYGVVGENNSTLQASAGGRFSGNLGIWATSTGSGFAAYGVYAEGGDVGLYTNYSDSYGVFVDQVTGYNSYGVYVSAAYGVGVFGNTTMPDNEWGLYTPDKLYVGTTLVSGGPLLLVAQNGGSETLEPGDVVVAAGLGRAFADSPSPVTLVRRADGAGSQAIAGVAYSLFVAEEEVEEHHTRDGVETTTQEMTHSAEGPVASGEYLLLCILGPCPVRVDASGGAIRPGDTLSVSGAPGRATHAQALTLDGVSFYAPGTTLGTALEPLDTGTRLIQVLVTLR